MWHHPVPYFAYHLLFIERCIERVSVYRLLLWGLGIILLFTYFCIYIGPWLYKHLGCSNGGCLHVHVWNLEYMLFSAFSKVLRDSCVTQCVSMTLELLGKSNYWVSPTMIGLLRCMYTLVKLKSNRIGLLIVELRPLEYLIHSQVKRACTEWDWNMRSAHAWDLFPGPWARSRRRR